MHSIRLPTAGILFIALWACATGTPVEDGLIEREPDDILNWFFHHTFKRLDEYFQFEAQAEAEENESRAAAETSRAWKVNVSRVILKFVLVVMALSAAALFIVGVTLFMVLMFVIIKICENLLQMCFARNKYKSNRTKYHVNA